MTIYLTITDRQGKEYAQTFKTKEAADLAESIAKENGCTVKRRGNDK